MQKKLTPSLSRKITREWNTFFPELGVYKNMWLLKRVDPIVLGICLNRASGNDSYRPCFHVHNLSNPFPVVSLTLHTPLLSSRSQVAESINVAFHKNHLEDAALRIAQQALLPLSGPISLQMIYEAYSEYASRQFAHITSNHFEDLLRMHIWSAQPESSARELLANAIKVMKSQHDFYIRDHLTLEEWHQGMQSLIGQAQLMRDTVEEQIEALKLRKVPAYTLSSLSIS